MIEYAVERDVLELTQIWIRCFGDSKEYIEEFYREHFHRIKILIDRENGKICSMIHMLPADILISDQNGEFQEQQIQYLYACATLPEEQRKGKFEKLLRWVYEKEKHLGACFLCPVPEKVEYYKAREMKVCLKQPSCIVTSAAVREEDYIRGKITAAEYKRLRDRMRKADGYVQWREEDISYYINCTAKEGAFAEAVKLSGETYVLIGKIVRKNEERVLLVIDCAVREEEKEEMLGRIAALYDCKRAVTGGIILLSHGLPAGQMVRSSIYVDEDWMEEWQ